MGGRAPEKEAWRERLDILEDRRTRCRKTGNAFKPSVCDREWATPKRIRQHPENERQDPGQKHDHIAVLQRDCRNFPDENEGEDTDGKGNRETDQQGGQGAVIAVRHRNEDGQQHEQGADQEGQTDISRYDLKIHPGRFSDP